MDSSRIEQLPASFDGLEEVRVLDGSSHDQVDWPLKEPFERFEQAEVGVCPLAGLQGEELCQKIQIAAITVESIMPNSRPKQLQAADVELLAEMLERSLVFTDQR